MAAAAAEDEGVLAHEHVVAAGFVAVVHEHAGTVEAVLGTARSLTDQVACNNNESLYKI